MLSKNKKIVYGVILTVLIAVFLLTSERSALREMLLAQEAYYRGEYTVTTYYPAPFGRYQEIETRGNTYLATETGNVGIGTTGPDQRLTILTPSGTDKYAVSVMRQAGSAAALYLGANYDNSAIIASNNNVLRIGSDNSGTFTEHMRIANSGAVGIGTTVPLEKLHIVDDEIPGNNINDDGDFWDKNANGVYDSGIDEEIKDETDGVMVFTRDGRVGIGTTDPYMNYKLDIYGGGLGISPGDGYSGKFVLDWPTVSGPGAVARIRMWDKSGNQDVQIGTGGIDSYLTGGSVGIGTTDPTNIVEIVKSDPTVYDAAVNGRTVGATLIVKNSDDTIGSFSQLNLSTGNSGSGWARINAIRKGSNSTDLAFGIANGGTALEAMRITQAGKVGIGTADPGSYKLNVAGNLYATELWYGSPASQASDYVFAPNYKLESIEEHAEYMWKNRHLAAISKPTLDNSGQEVLEIGQDRRGILEELEKAHIYIEQLNERIKGLEEQIAKLESKIK